MGVVVVGLVDILSSSMVELVGIRNRGMVVVVVDTPTSRDMVEEDTLHNRGIRLRGTVVDMVRLRGMVVVLDMVRPQGGKGEVEWVQQEGRLWD